LLYVLCVTPYRTPPRTKSDQAPIDDSRVALVFLAFFLCAVVVAVWPGVPNDASDPHGGRAAIWHRGEGGGGRAAGGHR
jgi:hypothetical protein